MDTLEGILTLQQGIFIQQKQLKPWKRVLKKSVYNALVAYCEMKNREVEAKALPRDKAGYSVFRGADMSTWVNNYANSLIKQ